MQDHIHQSNLIENINDNFEDRLSLLAWQYIENQPRLSRERVMQLHYLITHNQLGPQEAGHNRKVHVTVGGHACPEPYLAVHLLANWMLDMQGWRKLDPKDMHVRFEKIHPFVDGNGRTGRMLMWWHEIKLGREPTLIKYDQRQEYYKWFKSAADIQKEADDFIDTMLRFNAAKDL